MKKISIRLQEGLQKFSEGIEKLKVKFTEFGEKARFYLNNPDVFFKDAIAKIFKRDVEADKKQIKNYIRHILFGEPLGVEMISPHYGYVPYIADSEKTNNWLLVTMKTIVFSISISRFFETIIQLSNPSFNLNNWFATLSLSSKSFFLNY